MSIKIRFKQSFSDAVFDIDLTLPRQGISALFGRSGAGKTTIINVISGLMTPSEGQVSIGEHILFDSQQGINLPIHKRNIGYVFQDSRLFPHYSVRGNLLYGMIKEDKQYFDTIVKLLAIDSLLNRFPISLSGGEKQRVAIARALLSKPDLLLMDEPLASLDLPRKREILPFLEELSHTVNIPIVYVSHSLQEIARLSNHLSILDHGRITTSGPLEKVWSSKEMLPWQSFNEHSNFFQGKVIEQNDTYAMTKVEFGPEVFLWVQRIEAKLGSFIRLQVRSSDVSISLEKPGATSIRNVLLGEVTSIVGAGCSKESHSVTVLLELAHSCYMSANLTKWAVADLNLQVGNKVYVQVKGVAINLQDSRSTCQG
ncbi:molybdenum ABC transporter ATP-binding protein ModC [Vibrio sagamiensis]|uniref:Molybdenum import ATP-binding protein ModC n=1 Tax=Vibrio sagamiensis NBRC 104589 TaxID=1219064 RepID=A0A511QIV5_9VIBR|nr:molybdenum ABC transporter ATP-binding protein ModC [Vibrio sagamiensis]PNQ67423.1 molybdenum ABC transporter ATP-binding protein ModC [Vibrio agarivorans]GEM76392.1 molybdenum import ATP-binding protein ModC [Vibrio sagamiensis NBRC 104589]